MLVILTIATVHHLAKTGDKGKKKIGFMKQLFIMLVLDGGCRVAVAFYGGGGDAASAGQEVRNH